MREQLLSSLEEERLYRRDSERHLGEVMDDPQLERPQMVSLHQHVSRMEETVRTLLLNQGMLEQTAVDTVDIMKACKEQLPEEVLKQRAGLEERRADRPEVLLYPGEGGQVQLDTQLLLERLRSLERENSALALENEKQREQYECCLDEVANQVVQALLTQKDLREECRRLRNRVFDLEQHNHSVSVLFQHRARPSSDLLLQKFHSQIMSGSDLPERSSNFLFSRKSDPATHEVHQGRKAGLPVCACRSLSVWACSPGSCSSSELSLSSGCSDSSGSSTSSTQRPSARPSSLTWEKRLSWCSAAPSSVCPALGEQLPCGRKEKHILDALRRLQRPTPSCRASISGDKDCMNSNEGIYSLGVKGGGVSRLASLGGTKFSYDSDDVDDELPRVAEGQGRGQGRGGEGLSHSVSDSLCSLLDSEVAGRSNNQAPPPYRSGERPQELMSFINSFLSGGRTSALLSPALLEVCPTKHDHSLRLSDADLEDLPLEAEKSQPTPSGSKGSRGSRGSQLLEVSCLRRDQGRVQSADSRPRPFSLSKDHQVPRSAQSEESLLAMFDMEERPMELNTQQGVGCGGRAPGRAVGGHLAPRRTEGGSRNPREASQSSSKGLSAPPMTQSSGYTPSGSKIPNRGMPVSRGSSTDPPSGPHSQTSPSAPVSQTSPSIPLSQTSPSAPLSQTSLSAPLSQTSPSGPHSQTSPSSPPVKMSRYIRAASSRLPSRAPAPCVSPSSPRPPRRLLDFREPPTRDNQALLRSPSPPPPPGRTSSLLIRPNSGTQPPTLPSVRGPPPSYHPPSVPNLHHTSPCRTQDRVALDAGTVAPQLSGKVSQLLHQSPAISRAVAHMGRSKGTSKLLPSKLHPRASGGGDRPDITNTGSPKNVPPAGSPRHKTFKKASTRELAGPPGSKVSSSQPPALDGGSSCPQAEQSPTRTGPPNQKSPKTRLPSGFKAFVRSPPPPRTAPPLSGKQEKEHINTISRGTSNNPPQCDPPPHPRRAPLQCDPPPHPRRAPLQCDPHPPCRAPPQCDPPLPCRPPPQCDPPPPCRAPPQCDPSPPSRDPPQCDPPPPCNAPPPCDPPPPCSAALPSYSAPPQCDPPPPCRAPPQCDPPPPCRAPPQCDPPPVLPLVQARGTQKLDGDLFKRSISVSTKPHLKPALGMTGAKARSQSFSSSCMELSSVNGTRTQIITNSAERGNSLTRQSLLVDILPGRASGEGPASCPGKRLSHHGGMSPSHQGAMEDPPRLCSSGERSFQESGRLALVDQMGLRGSWRPVGGASQPQAPPQVQPCPPCPSDAPASRAKSKQLCPAQTSPPGQREEQASPPGCTIEEKVMLGIQKNMQKVQGPEKTPPSEPRTKTVSSLANWFGLRRAKVPASDTTADGPKLRDDRKEVKKGSVLGGRLIKTPKKNKRRKADGPCKDSQDQILYENSNKLSSIMDHCTLQIGQIANQIQCSTMYIGKDQLMKDLLGRSIGVKGEAQTISPSGISIPKKYCREMRDVEIYTDNTAIIVKQKMNIRGNSLEDSIPEATCQHHIIGSSSQMRTLDSGIGTFPPPDSASRLNGRHIPRSESSPGRVTSPPNQAPPSPASNQHLPEPALTPVSLGSSQGTPTMAPCPPTEAQSCLPKSATSDLLSQKDPSSGLTPPPHPSHPREATPTDGDHGTLESFHNTLISQSDTRNSELRGETVRSTKRLSLLELLSQLEDSPRGARTADLSRRTAPPCYDTPQPLSSSLPL